MRAPISTMTSLWRSDTFFLLSFLMWTSHCASTPEVQTPSTSSSSTSGVRRPPTMPGSIILLEPTSGTSHRDGVTSPTPESTSESALQQEVTTTDQPTSTTEVTSRMTTTVAAANATEAPRRVYSESCTKAVLEEAWPEWRLRPQTVRLQLRRENVTCHLAGCRGTTNNETSDDVKLNQVITVVLQNEDSMELQLDVPEVSANRSGLHEAVLQSLQGARDLPRGACVQDDSLLLWSKPLPEKEATPLTLGPEILTPGLHLLSVHVVGPDVPCPAVWQLNVSVLDSECTKGPGEDLCSQKGSCVLAAGQASYTCRCCPAVGGRYCEERDGCYEKPCRNGGFCVDIAEGLSGAMYQCLCPHGFRGSSCEEQVSPCDRRPCRNKGTCIANSTEGSSTSCLCPPGFRGSQCETPTTRVPSPTQLSSLSTTEVSQATSTASTVANDTEPVIVPSTSKPTVPSTANPTPTTTATMGTTAGKGNRGSSPCDARPCVHGMCEEEETDTSTGAYKCYCLPGYGGDRCEFEYDECDSGPCANGGQCEDLVAAFRCHCGPGYAGKRCELKVDLCRPDPCPPPARCVDKGNNYSCVCHPGYNGPGCTQHYDPCFPNPCQNGGSCWPSLDSFYCSCRGGFTGDACEDLVYPPPRPAMPRVGDPQTFRGPAPAVKASKGANGSTVGGAGSGPVDHLHNIYIAAATLAGACLIVVAVVTICHCRVHKTYQGFARKLGRSCAELKQHTLPRQILAEPSWERF